MTMIYILVPSLALHGNTLVRVVSVGIAGMVYGELSDFTALVDVYSLVYVALVGAWLMSMLL